MQTDHPQGGMGLLRDMTEAKEVILSMRVWRDLSEKGVSRLNPRQGKDREGRCSEQNPKQEQDEEEQR